LRRNASMYAGRAEYLGSPVSRASRLWAGCSAGQVRRLPVTKPHVCSLKCIHDRMNNKHLDMLALDFWLLAGNSIAQAAYGQAFLHSL